jgi:hypothetical protein
VFRWSVAERLPLGWRCELLMESAGRVDKRFG